MSEANVQTFVSHSLLSTLLSAAAEAVTDTLPTSGPSGTYGLRQRGCVSKTALFAVTIADPNQTAPGSFTTYDNCVGFVVDGTFRGAGAYYMPLMLPTGQLLVGTATQSEVVLVRHQQ